MRNAWVAYAKPEVIGETPGWRETYKARRENRVTERKLQKQRSRWKLHPPSNMNIILKKDVGTLPGGLLISMRHEVGRVLLHRRLARIVERDVTVNAVIRGGLEEAVEALGLGAAE